MQPPAMTSLIRRRILANHRVDPAVAARWVPAPLRPKLQGGYAIAGVCLIRLEQLRPTGVPAPIGLQSENGAHRIAVEWDEGGSTRSGVYIHRRDTDSRLTQLVGGRLFPGHHGAARFEIDDDGDAIRLVMQAEDGVRVALDGRTAAGLPTGSVFRDTDEASAFFATGSTGYSATPGCERLDGMLLSTDRWAVTPLELARFETTFFDDESRFPRGSVTFDHALVMRDIACRWDAVPDLALA